ncbi:MAG: hypothetical protein WKF77_05145, partial [Planctomycetaceae bacterium]
FLSSPGLLLLTRTLKKKAASLVSDDPEKKVQDAKVAAAKSAKDIADARKAEADSELAAIKSKIGEVPSSGISGSVKVEQGAASMETALLAARATTKASEAIANAVNVAAPNHSSFSSPVRARFPIFSRRSHSLHNGQSCFKR